LFEAVAELTDSEAARGDWPAALQSARHGVELAERWLKADPTSAAARGHYEDALRILGRDQRASGDLAGAEASFQTALEANKAWVAHDPGSATPWIRLGYALDDLSDVRRDQRRFTDCRDLRLEWVRVIEQALARDPVNTTAAQELSRAHQYLGQLTMFPEQARDGWRKVLELNERGLKSGRGADDAIKQVAEAHEWLGDLEDRLGNPVAAVEHCRKAVELKARIARDKNDTVSRASLGFAHKWLGIVSGRAGNRAESIAQFRKEIELREAVRKEEPDSDNYLDSAASAYHSLGDALLAAGDPGAAREPLEKSIQLFRKVQRSHSYTGETPGESLAGAIRSLAVTRRQSGDLTEARTEYRNALEAVEEAVKKNPNRPGPRVTRTAHLQRMGSIALAAGDFPDAEKWFRKAIDELQALDKEKLLTDPEDAKSLPNARRNLAVARLGARALKDLAFASTQPTREGSADLLAFRAETLARAGDLKGAAGTAEALRQLAPTDAENLFDTARCYGRMATVTALGRPPAKLPAAEKAARDDAVRQALEALRAAVAARLPDRRRVMTSEDLDAVRAEPGYRDLVATFGSPSEGK
jgi:tetratricopeptide (TPR) repeat protein